MSAGAPGRPSGGAARGRGRFSRLCAGERGLCDGGGKAAGARSELDDLFSRGARAGIFRVCVRRHAVSAGEAGKAGFAEFRV